MDSFEAWLDFQRGERTTSRKPTCFICGHACDGDTTINEDGNEVAICNEEDREACDARYHSNRCRLVCH